MQIDKFNDKADSGKFKKLRLFRNLYIGYSEILKIGSFMIKIKCNRLLADFLKKIFSFNLVLI